MESHRHRALSQVVLALDALLVVTAMLVAAGLHALARRHLHLLRAPPSFDQYAVLPFVALPLFLAWTSGLGLNRLHDRAWTGWQLVAGLAKLHLAVFLSLSVLIFLTQSVINRSLVAVFLACSFGLLLAERAALVGWQRYQYARGAGRERLLIVGGASAALDEFLEASRSEPLGPLLVGRLVPDGEQPIAPGDAGLPMLGKVSELPDLLQSQVVDHVIFFPPLHRPAEVGWALGACETLGVPASFQVEVPSRAAATPRVVSRGRFPFVTFDVAPKPAAALAIKHGADAFLAAVALVLLAPLLIAISLCILAAMGRPIFFVQERAGLYGRRFRMFKFRTMARDAEARQAGLRALNEQVGPVFKLTADPRVTRLGTALRRASLDEIPQLFNVLLGQMSLVGPRPLPLREQEAIVGWQRRRLSMKPGLTGLWQVSGRSELGFDEWMRLDLEYIDHWSLLLDVQTLARTVPAVLLGRGAR